METLLQFGRRYLEFDIEWHGVQTSLAMMATVTIQSDKSDGLPAVEKPP